MLKMKSEIDEENKLINKKFIKTMITVTAVNVALAGAVIAAAVKINSMDNEEA